MAQSPPRDRESPSQPSFPQPGSPDASGAIGILPAQHWVNAAEVKEYQPTPNEPQRRGELTFSDLQGQGEELDNWDGDSALGSSIAGSIDPLTASILEYRKIHGRTYHHEIGNASYW